MSRKIVMRLCVTNVHNGVNYVFLYVCGCKWIYILLVFLRENYTAHFGASKNRETTVRHGYLYLVLKCYHPKQYVGYFC